MTADDDNHMLKTRNETATDTFLLLFGVSVCVQFSLLALYWFFQTFNSALLLFYCVRQSASLKISYNL